MRFPLKCAFAACALLAFALFALSSDSQRAAAGEHYPVAMAVVVVEAGVEASASAPSCSTRRSAASRRSNNTSST